ncbi:MAG: phenylalanine--tRNA ligase subunit beta [Myxococcales bacterium]|nr:phenylalanine--tRNA ligase subunit beta [Myxococcales bacterium]MCB9520006.1 phenylalanine--tRNA ligase subunit beta [Myxococcales bacterium]MCB9534365.1 phenylalanine--tRNA ligase subunit beta [Myxococcales bacterium]
MRVSWSWLSEHVDLSGLEPRQVADRLTLSGLEVEGVVEVGADLAGVVVARVLTCVDHPQSDHLHVCEVDDGTAVAQVVCGAPNVHAGMVAPLARLGTTMPGGPTIVEASVRGVVSRGMLCSARELGLGDDHGGLLELPASATLGMPVAEALGYADTRLELSVTPNRSDALSIRGVAREVAALFGRRTLEPPPLPGSSPVQGGAAVAESVRIRIDDPDGCPRYAAAIVRGVRVAPSPQWLQARLRAVGQRPINNVVDVTNYVLFEQGQPLHAFDLARVRGGEITVRRALDGETLTSIDHVARELRASDLVIADAAGPVAIAGVMGGADSEIDDSTTDVLIECANFEPSSVRRTARRFGMHTESSHRFERGVDVERIRAVLERSVALLVATQEHGDSRVAPGVIDEYPRPYQRATISMALDLPARILGAPIDADEAVRILKSIGLDARHDESSVHAEIPAFRPDLTRAIDLVEEVGRVFGLDRIAPVALPGELGMVHRRRGDEAPRAQAAQPVRDRAVTVAIDALRGALAQAGLYEAVSWGMTDPARTAAFAGDAEALRLRNPLGEERSVLRRTLLIGLMDAIAHNVAHGRRDVGLFEVGHVFPPCGVAEENPEPLTVAGLLVGVRGASWAGAGAPVDGHDAVGLLSAALQAAGVEARIVSAPSPPWAHPAVTAAVEVAGRPVGWVGQLHPGLVDRWELGRDVVGFELDLSAALSTLGAVPRYAPIARTPGSTRDAALTVPDSVRFEALSAAVEACVDPLRERWFVFDVYRGPGVADGHYSVALRVEFRSASATLTDEQIEASMTALVAHLCEALGATRR